MYLTDGFGLGRRLRACLITATATTRFHRPADQPEFIAAGLTFSRLDSTGALDSLAVAWPGLRCVSTQGTHRLTLPGAAQKQGAWTDPHQCTLSADAYIKIPSRQICRICDVRLAVCAPSYVLLVPFLIRDVKRRCSHMYRDADHIAVLRLA